MRSKFLRIIVPVIIISFLVSSQSNASWAYSFVVWDGYVYVISDEPVENIHKKIGHVMKHSDKEGTYSGNFSNAYQKGTKYYSITGISTNEAIAVQKPDGTYVKAVREGKEIRGEK